MKKIRYSIIILFSSCLFYACSNEPNEEEDAPQEILDQYDTGIEDDIISHELEKETFLEKEQTKPNDYLLLHADCKRNLKGEWILKGTLENIAKEATFSNIHLTAEYYDKLDSLITSSDEILSSSIAPGEIIELKYTVSKKPKKTKTVTVWVKI